MHINASHAVVGEPFSNWEKSLWPDLIIIEHVLMTQDIMYRQELNFSSLIHHPFTVQNKHQHEIVFRVKNCISKRLELTKKLKGPGLPVSQFIIACDMRFNN